MSQRERRKRKEEKEKRLLAKERFAKSVNDYGISCAYCRIKNKNMVFYLGLGFCCQEHLELWKKQRNSS